MCWKYFLPACDVLKLCLDGFLNNSFKFYSFLSVCSSVLSLCTQVAPNFVSSWCRNCDFDWVSAIEKPHLRKLLFLGRNITQRIDFKPEFKYD